MKILVIGFPRSGTTLTYRIFKNHPSINKMFFEKWMLKRAKNRTGLIKKFPEFGLGCGEKIAYEKYFFQNMNLTIIGYCLKWNNWFREESKIVQIIRHPFDSLNSLVISKKRFPRGPTFEKDYREYLNSISKCVLGISQVENCLTIKYEDLVSDPKRIIKKLYTHCGIDNTHIHKERMNTGRIFNYTNKGLLFKYDERLADIIDAFNSIPGVKYSQREK